MVGMESRVHCPGSAISHTNSHNGHSPTVLLAWAMKTRWGSAVAVRVTMERGKQPSPVAHYPSSNHYPRPTPTHPPRVGVVVRCADAAVLDAVLADSAAFVDEITAGVLTAIYK